MSKNRMFVVACVLLSVTTCITRSANAADKGSANASVAFDKMKTLTGQWEATTEKGKVTSTIELVSNGTALLERVTVPGDGEMVTVYYLEGNRLVLTHYCSAGNQPHMQAKAFDPAFNEIHFDFASATNLSGAGDGHMHTATIKFVSPDAFDADWTFYKDGKQAFTVPIEFHRVR
ncbi:MAG TPA: hypothetical protein VIX19_11760 [Terriglobales bacterium]